MAENKRSFLLYCDLIHTVEGLEDVEAGQLLKHILRYVNDKNPCAESKIISIAFEPIKQQLKRDLKRYEVIREQKVKAGIASADKRKHMSTGVESVEQEATKPTVIVNDTVTVSVNGNENKKENIEGRKLKFASTLEEFNKTYSREMLVAFFKYWTEPNKSGSKFRQELEKTWELSRRLETWAGNDKIFKPASVEKSIIKMDNNLLSIPRHEK